MSEKKARGVKSLFFAIVYAHYFYDCILTEFDWKLTKKGRKMKENDRQ